MFKNHLKIAIRSAIRHKGNSIINISGLAIGLTCVILIALFVKDEFELRPFLQ